MPAADLPGLVSVRRRMRRAGMGSIVPAAVVLIWAAAARRLGDSYLLPGPGQVGLAFLDLWRSGRFVPDLLTSLGRVTLGFLLAALPGVPLGLLTGRSPRAADLSRGVCNFLRQVPPVALVPLLILWFGIGEQPKLLVIAYASFFPIFLGAELGARTIDPALIEVGRLYQRTDLAVLRRVILPSALQPVATGLRLGLGYGWRSLVIAEMLAASRGLGATIATARGFGRTDRMLVGVLAIGLAGVVMDRALEALSALLPWAGREVEAV